MEIKDIDNRIWLATIVIVALLIIFHPEILVAVAMIGGVFWYKNEQKKGKVKRNGNIKRKIEGSPN